MAVVPCASATPLTVRAIRDLISARTVASWVRSVPSIVTRPAMMLKRVPPSMRPMVRTRGCRPSICRETMSWRAWTISAATGIGSSPMWGCAPWTVFPSTSIRKVSEEAKIGPSVQPAWPTDTQLPTCRPKTASTFGSSSAPSFTMSGAPPSSPSGPPSSAGWNRRDDGAGETPPEAGQHLRRAEQHRRVGVVAAGVHDALHLAAEGQVVRLVDGESVHVGAQRDDAPRAAATENPHDAGLRHGVAHLEAEVAQTLGHEPARALLAVGELGVGVKVAPDGHDGRGDPLRGGADLGVGCRRRPGRGGEKGKSQQLHREMPPAWL